MKKLVILIFTISVGVISCRNDDTPTPEPYIPPDYGRLLMHNSWKKIKVLSDPPQDFGDGPKADITSYAIDSCEVDNKIEFFSDSTYSYLRQNPNCNPPTNTFWGTWKVPSSNGRLYLNGSTTTYLQIHEISEDELIMSTWSYSSVDSMSHKHTSYYIPYK